MLPARSNFEKVLEFDRASGVLRAGAALEPQPSFFDDAREAEACMSLIREEVQELEESVACRDFVETIDALADILYVTYGMGGRMGADMDAVFALVHARNAVQRRPADPACPEAADPACPGAARLKTNFEKVLHFAAVCGLRKAQAGLSPRHAFFAGGREVAYCTRRVSEGALALEGAARKGDYGAAVEALGDLLHAAYEMGGRMGVDMDAAFELVHANNMSKLCATEEEARRSVAAHRQKGVEAACRRNGELWVVYNAQTLKVLKPCDYRPVELGAVCGMD